MKYWKEANYMENEVVSMKIKRRLGQREQN